jgi:hypothetical protein
VRSTSSAPIRFARKKFFPEGWEFCVSQFLSLFHRYGYIYKPITGGNWSSANETWKLDDSSILKAISLQNEKYYIGSRAGAKTQYAVLDIDTESKYHTKEELDRLLQTLTQAGLGRSSLYRSSFSGGWHLYIFFDEPIPSKSLYQQLVKLLKLCNFDVAKGTLEVFPHPGYASLGMGLRLPLQAGFAWLDKKTLEVEYEREELSATKALEFFIDCLDSDSNSYADYLALKARISELETIQASVPQLEKRDNIVPIRAGKPVSSNEQSIFVASIFGHVPLNIDAEVWQRGRLFHLQGLTEHSQRAEAAFCLGHYFFYGDPSRGLPALGYADSASREQLIEEFLTANHNGFSKDIIRGRADATAQITRMANWVPPHRRDGVVETYTATPPISWVRENAKRKANARRRIQDALAALRIRKQRFSTVELQKAAGCGRDTLYKHADIWRQEYEDLADGFFASCPDDYNAVEDSNLSTEGLPCSPVLKEETPLGLVAARQVVFELSLLGRKEIHAPHLLKAESVSKSDQAWRDKVSALTSDSPLTLSISDLKYRLFVLANLLSVAPYEEDAVSLLPYVQQLRKEFKSRQRGPTKHFKDESNSSDSS